MIMMTNWMRTGIGALAAVLLSGAGTLAEGKPPRAVLELFTSQGCSSCPPADKLAAEFAKRGDVMVLTFPVDYWDYLGWEDTLASPDHTARQKAYALARGDRKVFTPQIVVNGLDYFVGSDRAGIERAIERLEGSRGLLALKIETREREGLIEVDVPSAENMSGEAWLLAFAKKREVAISRGENAKHHARYVNVVRKMTRLGTWNGKMVHFRVARAEAVPKDADGYVAVVQAGSGSKPGMILGLAQ